MSDTFKNTLTYHSEPSIFITTNLQWCFMKRRSLKQELAELTGFSINNREELAYIIKRAKTDLGMFMAEDDITLIPTQSLSEENKQKIIDWCKKKKVIKEAKSKVDRGYTTQAVLVNGKRRFVSLSHKYREELERCGVEDFYTFLSLRISEQGTDEQKKTLTNRVHNVILDAGEKYMAGLGFEGLKMTEIEFANLEND